MLTDFVWRTFENTGSIESYMFFRELHNKNKQKKKGALEEVAISTEKSYNCLKRRFSDGEMKLAYLRTDGIITRVVNFGEADKIITIFTRSHGKVQAFAKGARRPKSRIIAGSQFLSYCNFILYKGSEMYSVNSTDVIEPFYGVRNDLVSSHTHVTWQT